MAAVAGHRDAELAAELGRQPLAVVGEHGLGQQRANAVAGAAAVRHRFRAQVQGAESLFGHAILLAAMLAQTAAAVAVPGGAERRNRAASAVQVPAIARSPSSGRTKAP